MLTFVMAHLALVLLVALIYVVANCSEGSLTSLLWNIAFLGWVTIVFLMMSGHM
jgi:hypothetical protein